MKIQRIGSAAMVAALIFSAATGSQAATVNVFLDDGTNNVPGSSNIGFPYAHLDRDVTWDVGASAENGLSAIGAAVMEVRLMALGSLSSASSAAVTQGGGTGLGISAGVNGAWIGATNAVLFQLSFYEDAAKTSEITGVDISLKSLTPRVSIGVHATNMAVNAYAGSDAFSWWDANSNSVLDNADYGFLGSHFLFINNDTVEANTEELLLVASDAGAATDYFTIDSDGSVVFGEGDTFWLRRENLNGSPDVAYQLGAVTFDVERSISVFLDSGTNAAPCPGSSNIGFPYAQGDREKTWDVSATAEPALALIGAEVMEVSLVTIGGGGAFSRHMTTGGGSGLAVNGGDNAAWLDPTEAAVFQLSFYADAGKTTEITDLNIAFKAVTSRGWTPNQAVHAYTAENAYEWVDANSNAALDDADFARMEIPAGGWVNMFAHQDDNLALGSDTNLASVGSVGNGYWSSAYGTDSVVFGPGDTFWLRRENLAGQAVSAYQLGAVKFTVTPVWQGTIAIDQLSGTNAVGISWATTAGKDYRLESKAALTAAGWSTNTTVSGLGVSVTVTDAVDQAESFYRVVEE